MESFVEERRGDPRSARSRSRRGRSGGERGGDEQQRTPQPAAKGGHESDGEGEESGDGDGEDAQPQKRHRTRGKGRSAEKGCKMGRSKPIVPDSDRKPANDKIGLDVIWENIHKDQEKKIKKTTAVWDRSQDVRDYVRRRLQEDSRVIFMI